MNIGPFYWFRSRRVDNLVGFLQHIRPRIYLPSGKDREAYSYADVDGGRNKEVAIRGMANVVGAEETTKLVWSL